MPFKSTPIKYGAVAVSIHWMSAIAIFALLGSGFRATSLTESTDKAATLAVHVGLGCLVLILTLTRLAWWFWADVKPLPPKGDPEWQAKGAKAIHFLFYVVILGMVSSGIGMIVLSGAASILFGSSSQALPDFWDFLPRVPHGLGARLMLALLVLHMGAALYHHSVKNDGLIARMWYGRDGA